MTFSESLVEYLRSLNIEKTEFYVDSSPAVKKTENFTVVISSQNESGGEKNRNQRTESKRFTVSGTAQDCINKAQEILDLLVPNDNNDVAGFLAGEYAVFTSFPEKRPALSNNIGNIFFADFSVRFLIAKD